MHRNLPAAIVLAVVVAAPLVAGACRTTRARAAAVPPAAVPASAAGAARGSEAVVEREAWLMGAPLRARVAAPDRAEAARAIEAAFLAVEELEAELSSWRHDSDLGRLRAAPAGRPVPFGPRAFAFLEEAGAWTAATGAAFDPAIGALVDAWDLRGAGRVPDAAARAEAGRASGWGRIRLDPAARTVTRSREATWIDAGGFGKGAALRVAAEALRDRGIRAALLDFGGQLLVLGDDPAGAAGAAAGWPVALAHPSARDSALLAGRLLRGSLATSGDSERGIDAPAGRIGHVLDPRTGAPVPAWGSVTVAADDPVTADILATALFVMGPGEGRRWIRERADAGAVFLLDRDGTVEVIAAGALEERLVLESPRPGEN